MADIQNYAGFIAAILVFQLIPGAGTIAILNATARNGRATGMAAVCGTLAGDFVFMVAAVAGLAAVMQANPEIFEMLQWFGAGYLVWLGWRLLSAPLSAESNEDAPQRPAVYFRQAFAVSLSNPKVMLFFVSFFPLFLTPTASPLTLGVMMAHVTLLSLIYQTGLVLVGNAVVARLRGFPAARRITTRLAGVALIGLGLRLANSR